MADAAVEFLLGNLTQLLINNSSLISSVKDEVDLLCNDLRLLAAFVKQTTESRSKDAVVKELVRRIRIEVYEAEDIVDIFIVNASTQKSRSTILKAFCIPDYAKSLSDVRKEIERIRWRVKEINDRKSFADEFIWNVESFTRVKTLFPLYVDQEDTIFLLDKQAEKVMGLLKGERKELEVISVVGMGGLGKTTLAKKLYNDLSVRYMFAIRSWVYVTQDYSIREVFSKILYDVSKENKYASDASVNTMADDLRSLLTDVRYLIVLDDVWTKEPWDDLQSLLPNNNNGSRVLLTSRINDVALHASKNVPPYQLPFLTDKESWELLEKKVFPKGTRCSDELKDLGRQIARKCYGLPLAIVMIAGILRKKDKTIIWWKRVEEKVKKYVAMNPEQCMDVLALSYNHLPYDLKACFLYFGVFPEDFEIPVWKMIHIWVAEGFIQRKSDTSAEELAEENLQDLVDRNLVLVEKRKSDGGIKTCRIHDMLHDMCVKQAEEENFFKEIKGLRTSPYVPSNAFRRVSVHSRVSEYVSSKPNSPYVRSFLSYGNEETVLRSDLTTHFPGSFSLLRVLDVFSSISFNRFPSIRLVHLRYVALSGTFTVIPGVVSNLLNLQTLIVKTNHRKIKVQADLWKLWQLRHVYTTAASELPTPSSKSLTGNKVPSVNVNLRTMCKVSPSSCTDVILARTPNLQKLGVRGKLISLLEDKNGSCMFDNIAKLGHLQNLKLLNDTFPIPLLDGKLRGLPQWYKFPPKLKKLTLSDTMLDWEHMSVLGKLPCLEVLKLGPYAFVGERWEPLDGSFIQLSVLQIGKTDLAHWEAAGHHFPQLQRVSLKHCEKLVSVPVGLGDIPMLEVVELSWTSPSAIASARKIQKNFKLLVFPPEQEMQKL